MKPTEIKSLIEGARMTAATKRAAMQLKSQADERKRLNDVVDKFLTKNLLKIVEDSLVKGYTSITIYGGEDQAVAEEIHNRLGEAGYSARIDHEEVSEGGRDRFEVILTLKA
jgi:hypothetical protein